MISDKLVKFGRDIFEQDIILPSEIVKAFNVSYSKDQIDYLSENFPSEEKLHYYQDNGCVMVPSHPDQLSLLDIKSLSPENFSCEMECWFDEERNIFSRKDVLSFGWLIIYKGLFPNSRYKTWEDQLTLLNDNHYIPNAAELAWVGVSLKKTRNLRNFLTARARTSSIDSDGFQVYLESGINGLHVGSYRNDGAIPLIGLSVGFS